MTIKAGEDYALKLSRLADRADGIAKKAIYEGAKVVSDAIRKNIENLPEEPFRRLRDGESFAGTPKSQKLALIRGFGMTDMETDKDGNWNTKAGFEGYSDYTSKAYPNGLPIPLLARAIESGSSVRRKYSFVRPAVNASRKQAVKAMGDIIDEELKKTMK